MEKHLPRITPQEVSQRLAAAMFERNDVGQASLPKLPNRQQFSWRPAVIGTLGEIILYVEEMGNQIEFYRDVLGLSVLEPAAKEKLADADWVLLDSGACRLALHRGGRRRFGADAPKFVFLVDDIEAARAHLVAHGVDAADPFSPAPGVQVVNCTDPEGNRFSLESRNHANS